MKSHSLKKYPLIAFNPQPIAKLVLERATVRMKCKISFWCQNLYGLVQVSTPLFIFHTALKLAVFLCGKPSPSESLYKVLKGERNIGRHVR